MRHHVGQVVAVTEEIAGSELEQVPYGGALFPGVSLFPSEELTPGGASQLDVIDPIDFGDSGVAQLVATDGTTETANYIVPEEEPDVVNLDATITGTYEVGNMVNVLAPDGSLIKERWADVIEPNGEEVLRVRVPHTLYDRLALGIREDGAGEMVQFVEEGEDNVITDVLGRFPVQDLNSVLVTTDPSQSAARVDIDSTGVHEYEDDGTLAVDLTQGSGLDLAADTALGANVTRMIRWLLSDETRIAQLASWEDSIQDATVLEAYAKDASHTGATSINAYDSTGDSATVQVLAGHGFNSETIVGATGQGNKTIYDGAGNSDFAFADGSNLSAWRSWTPTLTGWSANPTNSVYRYRQVGKTVQVAIRQATNGTSNSTAKTISLPVTAATITNMQWEAPCKAVDSGTLLTTSGLAQINSADTTVAFFKDWAGTAWTNSGGHRIGTCFIVYEAA